MEAQKVRIEYFEIKLNAADYDEDNFNEAECLYKALLKLKKENNKPRFVSKLGLDKKETMVLENILLALESVYETDKEVGTT